MEKHQPEKSKDFFIKQKYILIMPYQANSDIWNKEEFNIEIIQSGEHKKVLIDYKDELAT